MNEIKYPQFSFDSDLTRAVIELERERTNLNRGTTPSEVFLQLKDLFQLLTSIMSARIEGNRTSILDAVTGAAGLRDSSRSSMRNDGVEEILNIQRAVDFIEQTAATSPINHMFIRELHRIVVSDLSREGDRTPGAYRLGEVSIGRSNHRPPWPADVPDHMSTLIDFIGEEVEPQMQLLQTAIAHHRFLWIHPFGNGNGRTARLLTYAMLVKQGYTSASDYRAVNPTAVFGSDRQGYYDNLEAADSLSDEGIVAWCTYVLSGLNTDLKKLGRLTDQNFVTNELLIPAIERLRSAGGLTSGEAAALGVAARKTIVKAGDLDKALPGSPSTRSQAIRRLTDRNLLRAVAPGARSYQLIFAPNELTVHMVNRLDVSGLLPRILTEDPI
ncbi:Fic family protein [Agreia sp. PsM10]|uniref:Fic family protein n=1 Tax=Agreia sp. PsM10 TaxID=3030533 RepID=UPI00263A8A2D|nr:Fic family protein [Agreia sp. PsM10]MDN4640785.1 Fic family protein [Agreia sp. PsM10]